MGPRISEPKPPARDASPALGGQRGCAGLGRAQSHVLVTPECDRSQSQMPKGATVPSWTQGPGLAALPGALLHPCGSSCHLPHPGAALCPGEGREGTIPARPEAVLSQG